MSISANPQVPYLKNLITKILKVRVLSYSLPEITQLTFTCSKSRWEICSKLTMKTTERLMFSLLTLTIFSHFFPLFLLLTLNKKMLARKNLRLANVTYLNQLNNFCDEDFCMYQCSTFVCILSILLFIAHLHHIPSWHLPAQS